MTQFYDPQKDNGRPPRKRKGGKVGNTTPRSEQMIVKNGRIESKNYRRKK